MECCSCVFWKTGEPFGTCRRKPPQPVVKTIKEVDSEQYFAVWPEVNDEDFCGEYKLKPGL